MPKPISQSIPSSSVAKLFDLSAAAKALQPQEPAELRQPQPPHEVRIQAAAANPYDLSAQADTDKRLLRNERSNHHVTDDGGVRAESFAMSRAGQYARSNRMIADPPPRTDAVPPQRVVFPEFIPSTSREFMLTPKADAVIEHLVEVFRRSTRTRLTTSHVARAVIKAIDHAMEEIERSAKSLPAMKLPPNARGGELERERFEAALADVIVSALRASAAYPQGDIEP